ncbi:MULTISPECIES: hypothetical protein [Burkholderia]|nr:hypothetical protein [Burkholderia contaminans]QFR09192.1 hypothetical protein SK875_A00985 [Burkholderia contaminans]VWB83948.1 hypothetical protein BCO23253_04037 [Burkholderia contaminans]VWD54304.1 hypothetical protein BCO37747_06482 [Burkholderia contaminans]
MITRTAQSDFSPGQVFFPEPSLYLVANYEPRPDNPNWVNVLCERHDGGDAICAYLSPVDAMLDAIFASKQGKRYYAIPASGFVPTTFIDDNNGRLALDVHLGWPARNGQLIARRNGKPVSCASHHEMQVPPEHAHHIAFRLEQGTLAVLDELYMSAGLFAYRETFNTMMGWPETRRNRAVTAAVQKMGGLAPAGSEYNQMALYDAEFEQWHFVSPAPLAKL